MSPKKQKYYVVWHGHHPGIYSSWESCQAQVKNFPNAVYKSFETKAEAENAYRQSPVFKKKAPSTQPVKASRGTGKIIFESISVDAACSGNPGLMEYRGVWTADRSEIFHYGPAKDGTNNIGEFLALVHALALLQKKNDATTPIYSDSRTAIAWVNRKKANTQLKPSRNNAELFDMIQRAEKWLKENQWKNPILKWETEIWGEIPADFGRK
ncbi:MAG: ribonuclease H family protein [Saprospiraceae bacterium]|nr:ribonuclease H family protein [Saprospiraceae bacterium]